MQFSEVIGQEDVKARLIKTVQESRVPHAQLFLGPAGSGKLALALAYATYINCPNRTETDSCGVCPSCLKFKKLIHPDLHFVFPTANNKKVKSNPESDLFVEDWRNYVTQQQAYVDTSSWYSFLEVDNKQGSIFVRDAASLLHKLSFKAYEGEYKIAIIWMAEKLRVDTANKLLKLLEEPPEKTVFILIAEEQEQLLATIKSRTVLVKIPKIGLTDIETALPQRFECSPQQAHDATLLSGGNWLTACSFLKDRESEKYYFQTFQQWMRLCFRAGVNELIDFSNNIKSIGREKQKELLNFGLNVFRNALLYNNSLAEYVLLPEEEKLFNANFSPYVNANNLMQMTALFEEGIRQIERNGYAPIIFLDISFKMSKLLRVK